MPDSVRETTFNGKPVLEFYTGEYQGKPQFFSLGVKKLSIIDDNIDVVRRFVDKYEKK
jgi:hypothetical protein